MTDDDYVLMGGRCEKWSWWKEQAAFMVSHTFICKNNHETEGGELSLETGFGGCPICLEPLTAVTAQTPAELQKEKK